MSEPLDLVVLGLGYVGLPVAQAAAAAAAGLAVVGLDPDRAKDDDLSEGDVAPMLAVGFRATTAVRWCG